MTDPRLVAAAEREAERLAAIAALRAALALGQVSVSEVAWSLGRDHPEFDRLMMAVTRLAKAKETDHD